MLWILRESLLQVFLSLFHFADSLYLIAPSELLLSESSSNVIHNGSLPPLRRVVIILTLFNFRIIIALILLQTNRDIFIKESRLLPHLFFALRGSVRREELACFVESVIIIVIIIRVGDNLLTHELQSIHKHHKLDCRQ